MWKCDVLQLGCARLAGWILLDTLLLSAPCVQISRSFAHNYAILYRRAIIILLLDWEFQNNRFFMFISIRILILHLKRYSFHRTSVTNSKMAQKVDIPRFLTLKSQCRETTAQPPPPSPHTFSQIKTLWVQFCVLIYYWSHSRERPPIHFCVCLFIISCLTT